MHRYLNGGHGLDGPGFDDVYILSLPSFTWIKSYPLDRNGTGDYPSHSLSCDIVNQGSQMLTIGGAFPQGGSTCDVDEVWGVHNIDLGNKIKSNFKKVWAGYDPTLFGYKVPGFVTSVIGGKEDGGATRLKPDYGFINHDLGTLLSMKAVFSNRKRLDDGRTEPGTVTSDKGSSPKSGLSTGAIVGIAVGAGFLLAVLVGLWLMRRKRRRRLNIQSAPATESFYSTQHVTQTSSPVNYPQSPDRWRDRSPRVQEYEWEDSNQVRYWRPFQVNSEPCEMDGQGARAPDSNTEVQYYR